MNETVPAPVNPVHTKKRDWHVFGFVVSGILLCTLAALVAFPQLTQSYRAAQSAKVLVNALPGALYVSDTQYTSKLSEASGAGYAEIPFSGLLISARQTPLGLVSVVRDNQGVFNVRLGDKTLVQSTFAIASADVSSDGAQVVYSVQTSAIKPLEIRGGTLQFLALKTNEWSVVVHNIQTGENQLLGAGVHPFFVDATHVVQITPAGIYKVNTETVETMELVAAVTPFVYLSPLVSPDRSYVGVARPDNRSIDIYRVSANAAELTQRVGLVPNASGYALGQTGLYVLRGAMMGPVLVFVPYDTTMEARVIGSLPKELSVGRIIP